MKKFLLLLIFIALAAGIIYLFVIPKLTVSATTTYNSYSAVIGTISNSSSSSGSISVKNYETLSSEKAGTVRQIFVSEEQEVKEGDKLIRLSSGEMIKADFDGRVNEISVEVGDSVSAGTSLIQIVDFSNMKVSMRVDEYSISDIYVGQPCEVTVKALDLTIDSSISHINRIASSSGSTAYYTVTAELTVTDDVLPGMQVTVTIPEDEAVDAVIISTDALSFDENNSAYVLIKNDADEMEKLFVQTGVDNDNYVQIVSGLSSGDVCYAQVESQAASSSAASGLLSLLGGNSMGGMGGEMPSMGGGGNSSGFDRSSMGGGGGGGMGGGNMGGGQGGW